MMHIQRAALKRFRVARFFLHYYFIQVSQLRELIEVKEVITPYGRSGS